MMQLLNKLLRTTGYTLQPLQPAAPASAGRPVGDMRALLLDLRARNLHPTQIVDVGAHAGKWAYGATLVWPQARILMLEPQVEMEPKLQEVCAHHPHITYLLAGAGPQSSTRLLTLWPDLMGSSLMPPPDTQAQAQGRQRAIPIVTIDALLQQQAIAMPQLIKLDIQGYELEALKGAESTFGHTEVYILEVSLLEMDDTPGAPLLNEVCAFMQARGYVPYDFAGFMRRPYDGALAQCDICFVQQQGRFRASRAWNKTT